MRSRNDAVDRVIGRLPSIYDCSDITKGYEETVYSIVTLHNCLPPRKAVFWGWFPGVMVPPAILQQFATAGGHSDMPNTGI